MRAGASSGVRGYCHASNGHGAYQAHNIEVLSQQQAARNTPWPAAHQAVILGALQAVGVACCAASCAGARILSSRRCSGLCTALSCAHQVQHAAMRVPVVDMARHTVAIERHHLHNSRYQCMWYALNTAMFTYSR